MKATHESLLALIGSLPKELQLMIQKELLRALLRPGRIFPGPPYSNERNLDGTLAIRPGVVEALHIPEPSVLRLARDIFYSQNMWVVAEGRLVTLDFLVNQMPMTLDSSRIVSIHLSFSCGDAGYILEHEATKQNCSRGTT